MKKNHSQSKTHKMRLLKLGRTVFVVICLLMTHSIFAAGSFTVNGIVYNQTATGAMTIYVDVYPTGSPYTGDIVIPSTITYSGSTYTVTSIGCSAFRDCIGLTSIKLPSTLTTIKNSGFQGCVSLTTISIPSSVITIESNAFKGCTNLVSVYAYPVVPPTLIDTRKLIILKLDNVISKSTGQTVVANWTRATDFLQGKKIKAALGIIGFSLDDVNPKYFQWIKDRASSGYFEFWNHGFHNRTDSDLIGEFEGTYQQQARALQKTDSLAKVKLGFSLNSWNPHWSATNEFTDSALSQMPNIRLAFGYPTGTIKYFKGFVMPRSMDMEYPTLVPDFVQFKAAYYSKASQLDYFFLQGHPKSWYTDDRWNNFVQVVEFLLNENVRFVVPSEFLSIMEQRTKSPITLAMSDSVVFSGINSVCKLYVPASSLSTYQANSQWKDFTILSISETALNTPNTNNTIVCYNEVQGVLQISGITGKVSLMLHDLNGRLLLNNLVSDDKEVISIKMFPKGVYIVSAFSEQGIIAKKIVK